MPTSAEIARMSSTDRMGEAMRLSLPHVPAGARTVVESMLTPETLTIVTGTLAVWAGAHCFGAGEIVDLILLGAGFITLGFAVFEGSSELRVHGLARALSVYRFPLQGGYMTVSQMATESCAIGTITLGGALFKVSISIGPIPDHD